MTRIELIERKIDPLRKELQSHALYEHLTNLRDVQTFMQSHVFAVWDFMSLLKSLQHKLTCTDVPWIPAKDASLARFVNEIVHGEESDVNENGEPRSHFEMYLEAMRQIGADTSKIDVFLEEISAGASIIDALERSSAEEGIVAFVEYTFSAIDSDKAHVVASAFTFGREDLIPDMFIEILNRADKDDVQPNKLRYYLERHIELDGDEHGPLSLKMVSELCGEDDVKWEEASNTAVEALQARINLWDSINSQILKNQGVANFVEA